MLGCALSAIALVPASANAANQWDWAVNGSPVPAGKKVAITAQAASPLTISAPALELTVKCEEVRGKGSLVGGMTGTGVLKWPGEKCEIRKDHKEPLFDPVKLVLGELSVGESAAGPPQEIQMFVEELQIKVHFPGEAKETLKGEGDVFAEVPPAASNLFVFGAAKDEPTLTIGGAPATLDGEVHFTVKKDPASTIGFAQLP